MSDLRVSDTFYVTPLEDLMKISKSWWWLCVCVGGGGGGGWGEGRGWTGVRCLRHKKMSKELDFCEKPRSNRLVGFIIIFVVLMKNRISSEYVPKMKALISANLMYYRIVIVENN